MDLFGVRKRVRPDATLNVNGGVTGGKRYKQETESISTGLGSKSKPCTKFFSTAGCPFGEGCHFLHFVPGGFNAVSHMANSPNPVMSSTKSLGAPVSDHAAPVVKTRMCNKYNTAEGCKFGEKCHFAHSERELGKSFVTGHDDRLLQPTLGGRLPPSAGRLEPPPPGLAAAASFGASATAKISVDASLAGAIIGKGGVNSKHICRITGAKLAIREHEADANLRNIELEGTFDQIKQASAMVRELIVNVGTTSGAPITSSKSSALGVTAVPVSNYKTKLCDNYAKGSCTFAERCHFAHGNSELRKSVQ